MKNDNKSWDICYSTIGVVLSRLLFFSRSNVFHETSTDHLHLLKINGECHLVRDKHKNVDNET
jgi:adenylosuccinate synthase